LELRREEAEAVGGEGMSISRNDNGNAAMVFILAFIFIPLELFALPKVLDAVGVSGKDAGGVVVTFVLATIAFTVYFSRTWILEWLSSEQS
jgi:hypothetical protein